MTTAKLTICARAAGLLAASAAALAATCATAQTVDMASGQVARPVMRPSVAGPALAPTDNLIGTGLPDGRNLAPALPSFAPAAPAVTISAAPPPASPAGEGDDGATLLADHVDLSGDNVLTASGGVVVWYRGARLVASRVVYDGAGGVLTIDGPINLTQPGLAGTPDETILIADQAQLDQDLQDGILRGARLVLARELQLAAAEVRRTGGGRMTTLNRVVASSCQVCAENPTPLWEIRARSITHDAVTHRLTFDRPQFRAFGVPIGILPALSAPDPTVDRATGFLRPEFRTTSALGFGMKLPYFITLGPSADLTVTPYLAASRTATVALRYRQAFANGATEWNGAITRDDIRDGDTRGYLFGAARFDLRGGYTLGAQVQAVSDRGYLLDYDVTDADRLWSGLTLDRYRRDRMISGRISRYELLREDEDNATSPNLIADALWQRAFTPPLLGGRGWLEWSTHAHRRSSDADGVGRDMARASVAVDWRRQALLPGGVLGAAQLRADADIYRIAQDSDYDRTVARVDPAAAIELRWPLVAHAGTATHILEPVVQLAWAPQRDDADRVPNEDSLLVEFDEGNLFSLNRAAGHDVREGGLRADLGIGWTRIDPAGWSIGLTAGRVLRTGDDSDLTGPLGGRRSDWLLAAHYAGTNGLAVANRALFDDDLGINRDELRVGWLRPDLQVSAGYVWIDADSEPGRGHRCIRTVRHDGLAGRAGPVGQHRGAL